jgi:hypothetical protein
MPCRVIEPVGGDRAAGGNLCVKVRLSAAAARAVHFRQIGIGIRHGSL